ARGQGGVLHLKARLQGGLGARGPEAEQFAGQLVGFVEVGAPNLGRDLHTLEGAARRLRRRARRLLDRLGCLAARIGCRRHGRTSSSSFLARRSYLVSFAEIRYIR